MHTHAQGCMNVNVCVCVCERFIVECNFYHTCAYMYIHTYTIFSTHTNMNAPWSLDLMDILGRSLEVLRFWLLFHRSSPLRIQSAIHDFGILLQDLGLVPLLFAPWFSFLSCLPSPVLFLAPSRLAFVVVVAGS